MLKKPKNEDSYVILLWNGLKKYVSNINDEIKPQPYDSGIKVFLKNLGRVGMVVLGFLLSPFFVMAFVIAFIVAL